MYVDGMVTAEALDLVEVWRTKGRSLSAGHKAKISASLKARAAASGAKADPAKRNRSHLKAAQAGALRAGSRYPGGRKLQGGKRAAEADRAFAGIGKHMGKKGSPKMMAKMRGAKASKVAKATKKSVGSMNVGHMYDGEPGRRIGMGMYHAQAAGWPNLMESLQISPILEASPGKSGANWRVMLIQAGTSGNGIHYSEEVLRKSVPLFEGVRAYADHPSRDDARTRPERSVRDVVGWYDRVNYDPVRRGIVADFHIVESADWLRLALKSAWDVGKSDLLGFSICAQGTKGQRRHEGGQVLESIDRVISTDVVTTPGAGGRLISVLESLGGTL